MTEEEQKNENHEHKTSSESQSQSKNDESVTFKKIDLWKGATFIFAILFLVALATGGFGIGAPTGQTVTENTDSDGQDGATQGSDTGSDAGSDTGSGTGSGDSSAPASVGDDPVMGQEDAPVTVVKFTDLGCPFCQRWHKNTLPQIKSNYVESGDVKVVYKDAPIPQLHPGAPKAHAAANCVYENSGAEAFYKFADVLYNNQGQFAKSTSNTDALVSLASDAGYDIESCLKNNDYQSEIDEDKQEARAAGLKGTPHFVVKKSGSDTGTPVQGAQPYSAFKQIIESKL
ncbi:MAG: DsbA family protein [Candidatus Paceibacteria bacterium]